MLYRKYRRIYDDLPISPQKRDSFKSSRKELNRFLDSESPAKIDNQTITRRDVLDVFIYGELAHVIKKKKEIVQQWISYPLFDVLVFNEFIYVLGAVTSFIDYVHNLNKEVTKELAKDK